MAKRPRVLCPVCATAYAAVWAADELRVAPHRGPHGPACSGSNQHIAPDTAYRPRPAWPQQPSSTGGLPAS